MMTEQLKEKINNIFKDFTMPSMPGFVIGVIKDGEIIFKNTYGLANLELEVPVKEDTVFNVGSVSKQFTAMCIALLEESGNIDINDSILKYIPELPEYCSKITIADLVYMTNGIRDFYHVTQYIMGVVEDDFVNEDEVLKLLCSIESPIFSAGEQWMYGNSGYFLLNVIVKKVTGKTLAQYAKENIFKPLGMKNTIFRDDRTKVIKNRAYGYCKYQYLHHEESKEDGAWDNHCLNVDNMELTGAGQLWTTLEDLYLWDQNYYNNKLGKGNQDLIRKISTSGKLLSGENCGYGYGLFLGERKGHHYQFHGGSTTGFLSGFYRVPDEKLTVIFLSNSNYGFYQISGQVGMGIDKYIGDLVLNCGEANAAGEDIEKSTVENSSGINSSSGIKESLSETQRNELKKYVGSYQCPQTASLWEIDLQEKGLVVVENREGEFRLVPIEDKKFKADERDIECVFENHEARGYTIQVLKKDKAYSFNPFIGELTTRELEEYKGEYYCHQLDTTFIVSIDEKKLDKLYIKNKDRHRNGIDFHYTPSIKDYFINFNNYTGNLMITFKRDERNRVTAFVYRDYDGDGREDLVFKKIS